MRKRIIVLLVILGVGALGCLAYIEWPVSPKSPANIPAPSLTWVDSGHTFIFGIASRFSVELDGSQYDSSKLACKPAGVIGEVSNISPVSPPYFVKRFEAVTAGECMLSDGGFSADIRVVTDPSASEIYTDPAKRFSISYPATVFVSPLSGGGLLITDTPAVRLDLARNEFADTNLSEASVLVGISNDPTTVASCTTATQGEVKDADRNLAGATWGAYERHDAGAGNRYDVVSLRTVHGNSCYEIASLIHYGVFENYSPGAVRHFDETDVSRKLEFVVQGFSFLP